MRNKVKSRPAESTTALAGAIVVIAAALGVELDEAAVVAVIAGIAAIPSIVTAIVEWVRGPRDLGRID